jgi:DNA-binding XRE family transcriptional regulator
VIAIEKGGYVPSVKLALELAMVLGVPLEEVFWIDEAN